jgi:hypothetical protein
MKRHAPQIKYDSDSNPIETPLALCGSEEGKTTSHRSQINCKQCKRMMFNSMMSKPDPVKR